MHTIECSKSFNRDVNQVWSNIVLENYFSICSKISIQVKHNLISCEVIVHNGWAVSIDCDLFGHFWSREAFKCSCDVHSDRAVGRAITDFAQNFAVFVLSLRPMSWILWVWSLNANVFKPIVHCVRRVCVACPECPNDCLIVVHVQNIVSCHRVNSRHICAKQVLVFIEASKCIAVASECFACECVEVDFFAAFGRCVESWEALSISCIKHNLAFAYGCVFNCCRSGGCAISDNVIVEIDCHLISVNFPLSHNCVAASAKCILICAVCKWCERSIRSCHAVFSDICSGQCPAVESVTFERWNFQVIWCAKVLADSDCACWALISSAVWIDCQIVNIDCCTSNNCCISSAHLECLRHCACVEVWNWSASCRPVCPIIARRNSYSHTELFIIIESDCVCIRSEIVSAWVELNIFAVKRECFNTCCASSQSQLICVSCVIKSDNQIAASVDVVCGVLFFCARNKHKFGCVFIKCKACDCLWVKWNINCCVSYSACFNKSCCVLRVALTADVLKIIFHFIIWAHCVPNSPKFNNSILSVCQVDDWLRICVFNFAVSVSCPAQEFIARSFKLVCRESLFDIINECLVVHFAACCTIAVEVNTVCDWRPVSIERCSFSSCPSAAWICVAFNICNKIWPSVFSRNINNFFAPRVVCKSIIPTAKDVTRLLWSSDFKACGCFINSRHLIWSCRCCGVVWVEIDDVADWCPACRQFDMSINICTNDQSLCVSSIFRHCFAVSGVCLSVVPSDCPTSEAVTFSRWVIQRECSFANKCLIAFRFGFKSSANQIIRNLIGVCFKVKQNLISCAFNAHCEGYVFECVGRNSWSVRSWSSKSVADIVITCKGCQARDNNFSFIVHHFVEVIARSYSSATLNGNISLEWSQVLLISCLTVCDKHCAQVNSKLTSCVIIIYHSWAVCCDCDCLSWWSVKAIEVVGCACGWSDSRCHFSVCCASQVVGVSQSVICAVMNASVNADVFFPVVYSVSRVSWSRPSCVNHDVWSQECVVNQNSSVFVDNLCASALHACVISAEVIAVFGWNVHSGQRSCAIAVFIEADVIFFVNCLRRWSRNWNRCFKQINIVDVTQAFDIALVTVNHKLAIVWVYKSVVQSECVRNCCPFALCWIDVECAIRIVALCAVTQWLNNSCVQSSTFLHAVNVKHDCVRFSCFKIQTFLTYRNHMFVFVKHFHWHFNNTVVVCVVCGCVSCVAQSPAALAFKAVVWKQVVFVVENHCVNIFCPLSGERCVACAECEDIVFNRARANLCPASKCVTGACRNCDWKCFAIVSWISVDLLWACAILTAVQINRQGVLVDCGLSLNCERVSVAADCHAVNSVFFSHSADYCRAFGQNKCNSAQLAIAFVWFCVNRQSCVSWNGLRNACGVVIAVCQTYGCVHCCDCGCVRICRRNDCHFDVANHFFTSDKEFAIWVSVFAFIQNSATDWNFNWTQSVARKSFKRSCEVGAAFDCVCAFNAREFCGVGQVVRNIVAFSRPLSDKCVVFVQRNHCVSCDKVCQSDCKFIAVKFWNVVYKSISFQFNKQILCCSFWNVFISCHCKGKCCKAIVIYIINRAISMRIIRDFCINNWKIRSKDILLSNYKVADVETYACLSCVRNHMIICHINQVFVEKPAVECVAVARNICKCAIGRAVSHLFGCSSVGHGHAAWLICVKRALICVKCHCVSVCCVINIDHKVACWHISRNGFFSSFNGVAKHFWRSDWISLFKLIVCHNCRSDWSGCVCVEIVHGQGVRHSWEVNKHCAWAVWSDRNACECVSAHHAKACITEASQSDFAHVSCVVCVQNLLKSCSGVCCAVANFCVAYTVICHINAVQAFIHVSDVECRVVASGPEKFDCDISTICWCKPWEWVSCSVHNKISFANPSCHISISTIKVGCCAIECSSSCHWCVRNTPVITLTSWIVVCCDCRVNCCSAYSSWNTICACDNKIGELNSADGVVLRGDSMMHCICTICVCDHNIKVVVNIFKCDRICIFVPFCVESFVSSCADWNFGHSFAREVSVFKPASKGVARANKVFSHWKCDALFNSVVCWSDIAVRPLCAAQNEIDCIFNRRWSRTQGVVSVWHWDVTPCACNKIFQSRELISIIFVNFSWPFAEFIAVFEMWRWNKALIERNCVSSIAIVKNICHAFVKGTLSDFNIFKAFVHFHRQSECGCFEIDVHKKWAVFLNNRLFKWSCCAIAIVSDCFHMIQSEDIVYEIIICVIDNCFAWCNSQFFMSWIVCQTEAQNVARLEACHFAVSVTCHFNKMCLINVICSVELNSELHLSWCPNSIKLKVADDFIFESLAVYIFNFSFWVCRPALEVIAFSFKWVCLKCHFTVKCDRLFKLGLAVSRRTLVSVISDCVRIWRCCCGQCDSIVRHCECLALLVNLSCGQACVDVPASECIAVWNKCVAKLNVCAIFDIISVCFSASCNTVSDLSGCSCHTGACV